MIAATVPDAVAVVLVVAVLVALGGMLLMLAVAGGAQAGDRALEADRRRRRAEEGRCPACGALPGAECPADPFPCGRLDA